MRRGRSSPNTRSFMADYKKSPDERRKMKIDALVNAWSGPTE